ncbi:hypothetical protein ABZ924_19600 [Streptomyces sp. NPDC046876]|uniref:hypothetical protein n=1 Tax=Streptomyces sp. NPDC046876 TaxID=3155616 RepID=UPI0033FAB6DD
MLGLLFGEHWQSSGSAFSVGLLIGLLDWVTWALTLAPLLEGGHAVVVGRGLVTHVTLISQSNFLLFTPLLVGVVSGTVEARHVSALHAPARSAAQVRDRARGSSCHRNCGPSSAGTRSANPAHG